MLSGVEAGSLDRGKAALERRNKKTAATGGSVADDCCSKVTGRVEVTRVNPDSLIDQLLRSTNLDDHSADEENEHSERTVFYCNTTPRSAKHSSVVVVHRNPTNKPLGKRIKYLKKKNKRRWCTIAVVSGKLGW